MGGGGVAVEGGSRCISDLRGGLFLRQPIKTKALTDRPGERYAAKLKLLRIREGNVR